MKLKYNDIHIMEKIAFNNGKCYIEKVEILQTVFYLYFEMLKGDSEYKVYSVSARTYKMTVSGKKMDVQNEEYLGNMPLNEAEDAWIANMQNTGKVFGKIGASKKDKGGIILACFTLIGLVLMIIGAWKTGYKKQVLARMEVTEGEVTDISANRLMGKRYAEGYYDVHVKYTVDGKTYEGYNGTTANEMHIGDKMNVRYDSKNPGNIIIEDDLKQHTFLLLYIGAIMTVVGVVLLIPEIKHRKKH